MQTFNKTKSWFSKRLKKKYKPFATLRAGDSNKIWDEKWDVAPDITEIQKTISKYYEQLSANKFDKLEEDKFLDTYLHQDWVTKKEKTWKDQ